MSYKSVDGLMRHLRGNGIKIAGSAQKRLLRNTGYFHGYKGYRFFGTSSNRLPFSSFDEVCLEQEIGLSYVNFKTLSDYVVLMCYYLKLLGTTKTELKAFVREYERITEEYRNSVSPSVANLVIKADFTSRMKTLKAYL